MSDHFKVQMQTINDYENRPKAENPVKIQDLTLRDGHQSLFATRGRTEDMIPSQRMMKRRARQRLIQEKGVALFMVLWVLILLSAIVTEFCFAMRTEVNMVRNFKEQTEAYYIALAGLNRAIMELIRNENTLAKKAPIESETETPDSLTPVWRMNSEIPPVVFGAGGYQVRIENEAGKINLNEADENLLKMMLNRFALEEEQQNIIIDSILDWRDENDLHRMNGAENDYYVSLDNPYECKNGDFDTIEELLLVRGITPELFYGGLKDMVSAFQDRTSKRGRINRKSQKATGGKICINAASKEMLLSLPQMTEELAQAVIDFRKDADFKTMSEVSTLLGPVVFGEISKYLTLTPSPYYEVIAVGRIKDSRTRQGVAAMVEINSSIKNKYRLVQWNDRAMLLPPQPDETDE